MFKYLMTFSVLALCAVFVTPTYSQAKSDYDRDADFTKYKTYTFAGWQKDSDKQLNDLDKKRILESLKSEFDARDMTLVDSDGEGTVSIYIVIENKSSVTAYTNYNGAMGYRGAWGWGMGAGMSGATTTYNEEDYQVGTLIVDLYDANGKNLIWQGVMKTTVKNPKKREKSIPKGVGKLMSQYPISPTKK